jgi:hypothetical protein
MSRGRLTQRLPPAPHPPQYNLSSLRFTAIGRSIKLNFRPEGPVGFFESNPWLLLPIIIITVEGWSALKNLIRSKLRDTSHE